MTDPFVHLHVASGWSLRHGASHPEELVTRAAELGMDTLALTDRDALYGAVKFAKACLGHDVRPVLGVDLTVLPTADTCAKNGGLQTSLLRTSRGQGEGRARRTPARGGAAVDPRHPRVVVLARHGAAGWAALSRLVSATHLGGERGKPAAGLDLLAEHAADGHLVVLLGPTSELGRALAVRRPDLARAALAAWREHLPDPTQLLVEVVTHHGNPDAPPADQVTAPSDTLAARLLGFAHDHDLGAVLTNTVRYATPAGAATADVLDATRRLVPLRLEHVDRRNAEAHLKSGAAMRAIAEQVVRLTSTGGSTDRDAVRTLLDTTRAIADACALDPARDLGLGAIHLPELEVVDSTGAPASVVLRSRAEAGIAARYGRETPEIRRRLDDELATIDTLGYWTYFLTVAEVCDLTRSLGIRVAARGSGAGSLVLYLLGVSGVDPLRYGLLMERFLSPRRQALPDVDIDVEAARRMELYEKILARFGGDRCVCVSMTDTYRIRHAIRDVGAALGLPPGEIDSLAKAFPHIRARDARAALRDLPELRASGIGRAGLDTFFGLVESLDGLPRHMALHPCAVLLSDGRLLDRTPVEASYLGFPMSQFDKDDVEDLGLLKLDVLGIRMQSAMAHAVEEIVRVDGPAAHGTHPDTGRIELDDEACVPRDDPATYALIQSTHTLGCFQIESPGQRELVGKYAPETFEDLIIDISLFRPGPVKTDMVTPFLRARHDWAPADYLHPSLRPALAETYGVVVFHEQVIRMIAVVGGVDLAEADELRRELGSPDGQAAVREWLYPRAFARGYTLAETERIWDVLRGFASFGFCKAHAAAFALPTYQSAWLKAHHPAAFLAGVLTHDPGMYPKRLILDDARQMGIAVLGLDVNASTDVYRIERVAPWDAPPPGILGAPPREPVAVPGVPDARDYGIRLSLADVKGISGAEVARVVAGQPYATLADFWHRARVSRPVVERLVVAGAFDSLYGLGSTVPVRRRGQVTRRDLLLQVADLDRWSRSVERGRTRSGVKAAARASAAAKRSEPDRRRALRADAPEAVREEYVQAELLADGGGGLDVVAAAAAQSQAGAQVREPDVQLALDLGDAPDTTRSSGLPEMTGAERVRAELDVLGLDVSRHVVDFYAPMLRALGVTRSADLLRQRSRAEVLISGVKVATQTPPIRSGRRVVFLTLDDGTGPSDSTFFEDAQGPYAATVFHSWLLVVRGVVRRTGPRGISVRATGAWELSALYAAWETGGLDAVLAMMRESDAVQDGWVRLATAGGDASGAVEGAAGSRSTRPVMARPDLGRLPGGQTYGPGAMPESGGDGDGEGAVAPAAAHHNRAGGMGQRRVLVHASGFELSPYADVRPPGEDTKRQRAPGPEERGADRGNELPPDREPPPDRKPPKAPRKLWHSSPGSSGA